MKQFHERLKLLRKQHNLKQSDIATKLGIKPQSYSAYETGREPKYELLCQLSSYYGVTIDYLLGTSKYPQYLPDTKDKIINEMDAEIRSLKQALRQITQIIDNQRP